MDSSSLMIFLISISVWCWRTEMLFNPNCLRLRESSVSYAEISLSCCLYNTECFTYCLLSANKRFSLKKAWLGSFDGEDLILRLCFSQYIAILKESISSVFIRSKAGSSSPRSGSKRCIFLGFIMPYTIPSFSSHKRKLWQYKPVYSIQKIVDSLAIWWFFNHRSIFL